MNKKAEMFICLLCLQGAVFQHHGRSVGDEMKLQNIRTLLTQKGAFRIKDDKLRFTDAFRCLC